MIGRCCPILLAIVCLWKNSHDVHGDQRSSLQQPIVRTETSWAAWGQRTLDSWSNVCPSFDVGSCVAWRRALRQIKADLRRCIVGSVPPADRASFGLRMEQNWEAQQHATTVVILVHGFNSTPAEAESLLRVPRQAGCACGALVYPNDQPIVDSGGLLAKELKIFSQTHPEHHIVLLAYSMGGLVCRAAIEDPCFDNRAVRRLVMVAPPNHGTSLSRLACGVDVYEYLFSPSRLRRSHPLLTSVEDGLAEAAEDMVPGSPFLQTMNRRPRNPLVQYTILLGNGGPVGPNLAKSTCRWLDQFFGADSDAHDHAEPWASLVLEMDECTTGMGDGVVSVERGSLDGVDDTLVIEFDHLSVLRNTDLPSSRRVRQEIMKRISADLPDKLLSADAS